MLSNLDCETIHSERSEHGTITIPSGGYAVTGAQTRARKPQTEGLFWRIPKAIWIAGFGSHLAVREDINSKTWHRMPPARIS